MHVQVAPERSPTKTVISLLVTALLVAVLPAHAEPSPLGDDDAGSGTDAGDHQEEALTIAPGSHSGRTTYGLDEEDWFAFNVSAGQGISARLVPQTLPSLASVYLTDGDRLYFLSTRYDRNLLAVADGTWYFEAHGTSTYGFAFDVVDLPPQDDAGSGGDAAYGDPVALPDGASDGTLNKFDVRDYYFLDVVGTQHIHIVVESSMPDPLFGYLKPSGCCDAVYGFSDEGRFELSLDVTDSRVFLEVSVINYFGSGVVGGEYALNVTRTAVETPPLPDVTVTKLIEHRKPIQTDFGHVPNNVNERRVYEVEVTNLGVGPADDLEVFFDYATGHRHDLLHGSFGYARKTVDLAPGESTTLFFTWDTTARVGDHTIYAYADGRHHLPETDEENNLAYLHTYVRVGGLL